MPDARRPAAQPACQSEAVLRLVQMHVEDSADVRHGVLSQSLEFRAGGERGRTQAMLALRKHSAMTCRWNASSSTKTIFAGLFKLASRWLCRAAKSK